MTALASRASCRNWAIGSAIALLAGIKLSATAVSSIVSDGSLLWLIIPGILLVDAGLRIFVGALCALVTGRHSRVGRLWTGDLVSARRFPEMDCRNAE